MSQQKFNNGKPVIFYSFIVCPYAIRVRTVLEELNIPYEYREIDLYSSKHLTDEYKKINPLNKVPAIVLDNGEILIESDLICEYLI